MELSNAAGRCYALAGRLRNAALMRSDVADALAARGDDAAAAALYERHARLFLREAWHRLAALVLRKLARAQQVTTNLPSGSIRALASAWSIVWSVLNTFATLDLDRQQRKGRRAY